jgi:hypothetical protein
MKQKHRRSKDNFSIDSSKMDLDKVDLLKYKIDQLNAELNYRLERIWQIFAWASSLLVAIIGGAIALRFTKNNSGIRIELSEINKYILVGTIIILVVFSIFWIGKNIVLAKEIKIERFFFAEKLFSEIKTNPQKSNKNSYFSFLLTPTSSFILGYTTAIFLLGVAACLTILFF